MLNGNMVINKLFCSVLYYVVSTPAFRCVNNPADN